MSRFTRGVPQQSLEAQVLDDETKLRLCMDFLSEIGARNVQRPTGRGEIVHSCPLPYGQHRNGDSSPSASLNYKKLVFKCLGCGAGGNFLWLIAVCRGEDDGQAQTWLNEQTGLGGTVIDLDRMLKILDALWNPTPQQREEMPIFPRSALDPWTFPEIHPYLTETEALAPGVVGRGIPEENCRRFRIGYAPDYPMGFRTLDDGTRVPMPPQERIIIPVFWEDQLVGWQARRLRPEDEPKYKNSPKFPRDRVLYGWPGPRQDIVLVESPMSVLRHCHHQPMVASFGKELTTDQLRILHRARSVTLWLDPDEAGWKGTERAIEHLSPYVPLRVVSFPYRDVDPADLSDTAVDRFVAEAVPWGLWRRPRSLSQWREQ